MQALQFAMRHPVTVMVAMAALALGSVFAVSRMRTDVFPDLNMPIIYCAQAYGGMDSAQMEGLITAYYEYAFLYMSGIDHIETRNIQNLAVVKLYFHPGTDMAQAMAEASIFANRAKAYLPPGSVNPFILRLDASSVPVSYLVLSSETRSISELSDHMLFRVRPILASLPGASAPQPFGGSLRTIVGYLDPDKLRMYRTSPQEVADALNRGNTVAPSGNARIRDQMPVVSVNSIVVDIQHLGDIPLRPGQSIYLRDIGRFVDESDIPLGWALVDGRRSIYMPIVKTADASTLTVVNELKDNLDRMRSLLPEDVKLTLEFDQSPYVANAVSGVVEESALGAILTGLMVLLFLRDMRSALVVVLTIPLALMGAVFGLWMVGQTINLMTLGGLSLAVGILVDEGTVVIENIHTQMGKQGSIARAVKFGTSETLVPNLLAMLCVLAVFVPSFLMEGAARGLFVPLAIAVGFAMIFAFVLSITFVPVLSVWLLRHQHADRAGLVRTRFHPIRWALFRLGMRSGEGIDRTTAEPAGFAAFAARYTAALQSVMRFRLALIPLYLVLAVGVVVLVGPLVGREIAPQVDSGQFQLKIRAPAGTRVEISEEITREALAAIKEAAGPENVSISVAYVGVTAPTYTVNSIYLWTGGTDQGVMRIALNPNSGVRVEALKERLRRELPERLRPWLAARLARMGYGQEEAAQRVQELRFSFEPADVVNQVMSFGSPAPIEVVVSSPNLANNREYAERIHAQLQKIAALRDLQFSQVMNYPRLMVQVDRERAGQAGVTESEAATATIAATSSSRYVVPVFWSDPKSGIGYQVQLEVPPPAIDSIEAVETIPVRPLGKQQQLLLRDIAQVERTTMPEEYDRLNQMRYVSLTANIAGEDLGRVSNHIDEALKAAGEPPRGCRVEVRGQVLPMLQMFRGLAVGLALAVVVVFLMLTAYFQSVRLSLVAVATAPAVVAGVTLALIATGTTLNIESFMGAIMAIGVAVANAILLVTFAERNRLMGMPALDAAVRGAHERLRPILMTSCAMIAGMVPMSLGLGEGGEQTAPLGRAVIGGLAIATLSTLFVLPAVFAVVMGKSGTQSPSIDPDDPESPYRDAIGSTHAGT